MVRPFVQQAFAGYFGRSGTVHNEGWTWVGERLNDQVGNWEGDEIKETVHIFKYGWPEHICQLAERSQRKGKEGRWYTKKSYRQLERRGKKIRQRVGLVKEEWHFFLWIQKKEVKVERNSCGKNQVWWQTERERLGGSNASPHVHKIGRAFCREKEDGDRWNDLRTRNIWRITWRDVTGSQ